MKQIPWDARYILSKYKRYYNIIVLIKLYNYILNYSNNKDYALKRAYLLYLSKYDDLRRTTFLITKTLDYFDTDLKFRDVYDYVKEHHIFKFKKERKLKPLPFTEELKKKYWKEIKNKAKKTKLVKYGDENYSNREKYKKTCLEKFGVDNVFKSDYFFKKNEETCLEKYGVKRYQNSDDYKTKVKQTMLERYGKHYFDNSEIVKQKYLEKYGVEHNNQKHIKNYDKYNDREFIIKNFIRDGWFLIEECKDFFNIEYTAVLCLKNRLNIDTPNKGFRDKTQRDIFKKIKIKNKILNDRHLNIELDIYLPDYQLAVEYNGLMFHSQGTSEYSMFNTPDYDKNYHLNKTLKCNKNNIQLLHIFEGEDINLWLSMINNKLGLNKKIYARKCIIKELKYRDVKDFLDSNHLQRSCTSKINLGLYYNNKLIQVMTFSKPRFNKNYEYELIRLCSLKNTTIVGGASKLLSYFIKKYNPKNIISYANRRFSNGSIYEKLGFKLIGTSNPNYFYFNTKGKNSFILESRNKFQKHKLSKILTNYDETLTESQNMFNNGYRRIFDCGNLVYELNIDNKEYEVSKLIK